VVSLGDRLWLPDTDHVWLPGKLASIADGQAVFRMAAPTSGADGTARGDEENPKDQTLPTASLAKYDQVVDQQLEGVDDICQLSTVGQASMLHTVRVRYVKQLIYTRVGRILVSLNPFTALPIFSVKHVDMYRKCTDTTDLEPHIFGIGKDAVTGIRTGLPQQVVLISGESGAGKTEAAKLILSFVSESVTSSSGNVQDRILQTSPIFEAIGNAMTVRNSNSSRFGKWLDMKFSNKLEIVGCGLTQYLLETTRICSQNPKERNYHVFFQMIRGLEKGKDASRFPSAQKKLLLDLKKPEAYRYLKGGQSEAPGIDDVQTFDETLDGFACVGFSMDTQFEIFRVLTAVLNIGNCDFKDKGEESVLADDAPCKKAAELLGCKEDALAECMLVKTIKVGGDTLKKPLDAASAQGMRDGLARMLYGRLFVWLVARMNKALSTANEAQADRSLGVLDIAGFESFETNSLEQLLINLSNEHLQQSFNATIFTSELEELEKEGITLGADVTFADNSDVLALISGKRGILDLLDESVALPKATDASYQASVLKEHEKHPRVFKTKFPGPVFGIKHFAGDVLYTCGGFLEKNADKPPDMAPALLDSSSLTLVKELGQTKTVDEPPDVPGKKKKAATVCSAFQSSMKSLMANITNADRHYIRCIKPNSEKVPSKFTSPMVLEQLLFSGVLEAVNIRQVGYSARILFTQFAARYGRIVDKLGDVKRPFSCALPAIGEARQEHMKKFIAALDQHLGGKLTGQMAVGRTKVMMKMDAMKLLDAARSADLQGSALMIQKHTRKLAATRKVKRLKEVEVKMRGWLQKIGHKAGTKKMPSTAFLVHMETKTDAVKQTLKDIEPIMEAVEKAGLKNHTVQIVQMCRVKMSQELEIYKEMNDICEGKDPIELETLLARSEIAGLHESDAHAVLKTRLHYLMVELPLEQARAAGVLIEDSGEPMMAAPTRQELEELVAEEKAAAKRGSVDVAVSEEPGRKMTMQENLAARKTVTGLGAGGQLAILTLIDNAIEDFEIGDLERHLGEAVNQGLNPEDLGSSMRWLANIQSEDFLNEALEEIKNEEIVDQTKMQQRVDNIEGQLKKLKELNNAKRFDAEESDDEDEEMLDDFNLARYPRLKPAKEWMAHQKSSSSASSAPVAYDEGPEFFEGEIQDADDPSADVLQSYMEEDDVQKACVDDADCLGYWMRASGEFRTLKAGKRTWRAGKPTNAVKSVMVKKSEESKKSHADAWGKHRAKQLSHSTDVIAESLTIVAEQDEELAIQNFTNILYYCADKPAQNLVRQASFDNIMCLAMRTDFCNEVFVQVLKQLTGNHNPRSRALCWHLLLLICQSVLPGEDFFQFIRSFFSVIVEFNDPDLSGYALGCAQALEMRALPVLRGHLQKKKPSAFAMKSWDKRFFIVGNHQMFWWATQEDSARPESARPRGGPLCKGVIDFIAEDADIVPEGETMFKILPKTGWSKLFENAQGDLKRQFLFDTKDCELDRDTWIGVVKEHMAYADRFRTKESVEASNAGSFMQADAKVRQAATEPVNSSQAPAQSFRATGVMSFFGRK